MRKRETNEEIPKKESKYVDFKERFDVNRAEDWCEIIKDVVAMANSGGGSIFLGLKNDGSPSLWNPTPMLELDPAKIVDKIAKYTGEQFSDFGVTELKMGDARIAKINIQGVSVPMVFAQPGTYEIAPGKQKTSFGRGTVYFRHGAKSEPGSSSDLKRFVEREIETTRKSWLGNIRKVVKAPAGSSVSLLPPAVVESSAPTATPIRITNDPSAPVYQKVDPDKTHPFRQKEVVQKVNQKLNGRVKVSPFDIYCVRRVYEIEKNMKFFYKSKFASPQYSEAFVEFIVNQFDKNPNFFTDAKESFRTTVQKT